MIYEFNISETKNNKVDIPSLVTEINDSEIPKSIRSISNDEVKIFIDLHEPIQVNDEELLGQIISDHEGDSTVEVETIQTVVTQQPAFADKYLPDGRSIFRRKHGLTATVASEETKSIKFTVPYTVAKIDEIEIVNCVAMDKVDFIVLDSVEGTYTGAPSYKLNQFGFSVVLSDGYYSDSSNYDAELNGGMQIEIVYKNSESVEKNIGLNIVLHEVK